MLREQFNELIMQEAAFGFNRGLELFIESLNEDMEKEAAITENAKSVDNYLDAIFENVH